MVASKVSHTVAAVPAAGWLAGAGGSGRGVDGAALHCMLLLPAGSAAT